MLIFTAPGGVGVNFQFNMTYLPEFITFNDAGAPLNNLRVETKEEGVLHDWPAAAIAAVNGWRHTGAMAANQVFLRIANGKIPNRNVTISGQTSAIGAINMFCFSDNTGTIPFKSATAQILALQPTEFTDFAALWFPNLVTVNDRMEVTFHDGTQETMDVREVQTLSTIFQAAPVTVIDNLAGTIKKVIAVDVAGGGAAYILRYALPGA